MQHTGVFLITAAVALAAEAHRKNKFIPGPECGTVRTIKMLDGNPTMEEEADGCIYINRRSTVNFRGATINVIILVKLDKKHAMPQDSIITQLKEFC